MDQLYRVWNGKKFHAHVHEILFTAIRNRQKELAELLVLQTPDINRTDLNGATALHYAVRYKLPDLALQLVDRDDININIRNKKGETALGLAIQHRNTVLAKHLIRKGADINLADENGHSPLHIASLNGNLDLAQYLIGLGANVNQINIYNESPLIIAVRDGFTLIARALLDRSPDIQIRDRLGNTALHYAALNNYTELISSMVKLDYSSMQFRNHNKLTPLATATLFSRYEAAARLVGLGADTQVLFEQDRNLLHLAGMSGDIRFIALYHGVDINHQDDLGNTPLQNAAYYQRSRFALALLEKNPKLDIKNKKGNSILHMAAWNQEPQLIHSLVKNWPGMDINDANDMENTPLHIAAKYGRTAVAEALLQHGANIHAKTSQQVSALHYAALNGHESTALLLIEHKADVQANTLYKDSVLHMAAKTGLWRVCEKLILMGVKIDAYNFAQEYPVQLAIRYGNLNSAKVLFDNGAVIHISHQEKDVHVLHEFTVKTVRFRKYKLLNHLIPYLHQLDKPDKTGNTLLHYAVINKDRRMLRLLLEHNANPNLLNQEGFTPLQLALQTPQLEIPRLLSQFKADGLLGNQQPPLHTLLARNFVRDRRWKQIFSQLLENTSRESINRKNRQGNTLLHLAIINRHMDITKQLLDMGIDKYIRNKSNKTAFDIAKEKHLTKILVLVE